MVYGHTIGETSTIPTSRPCYMPFCDLGQKPSENVFAFTAQSYQIFCQNTSFSQTIVLLMVLANEGFSLLAS